MKTFFLTIAAAAVAFNLAANIGSNTAERLEEIQVSRDARLCEVNRIYCR